MAIPPFVITAAGTLQSLPGPTFLPAVKKTAECRKCDISAARLSTKRPLGFPSHPHRWFSIVVYLEILRRGAKWIPLFQVLSFL